MSFLRELRRFLWPRQRWWLNHGGRLINPYALPDAADEEKVLMLAGVARSPDDARSLLKKHGTSSARDVLRVVARRKRLITFKDRWQTLIRRIDGHNPRDAYGGPKYDQPIVRVQYRYRNRH